MKHIQLCGSWIINASREDIYKIISDFENYPEYFPAVTKSIKIIDKQGNNLAIEAKLRYSFDYRHLT